MLKRLLLCLLSPLMMPFVCAGEEEISSEEQIYYHDLPLKVYSTNVTIPLNRYDNHEIDIDSHLVAEVPRGTHNYYLDISPYMDGKCHEIIISYMSNGWFVEDHWAFIVADALYIRGGIVYLLENETAKAISHTSELPTNVIIEEKFTISSEEQIDASISVGEYSFSGIGDYAFYKSNIESISIPACQEIGMSAFSSCRNIKNISLLGDIEQINSDCFTCCSSLETIDLSSVNNIGTGLFSYCSSIKSVSAISWPKNMQELPSETFKGCSSIQEINWPKGITSIGKGVFSGCTSLKAISIPPNITTISDDLFSKCTSLTNIEIPNHITQIGANAFFQCSSLSNIEIPAGVTSIGSGAFSQCSSLSNIEIPAGVTSIGSGAFRFCPALTNVVIPSRVTNIEYATFHGCTSLTSIKIPENVTSIGNQAFCECINLKHIDLPKSISTIESQAFRNTGLEAIILPDAITVIPSFLFDQCPNLKTVTIPQGITEIKMYAFANCSSLESLTILSKNATITGNAFESCNSLKQITMISPWGDWLKSIPSDCEIRTLSRFAQGARKYTQFVTELPDIEVIDVKKNIDNISFKIKNEINAIIDSVTSGGDLLFPNKSVYTWNKTDTQSNYTTTKFEINYQHPIFHELLLSFDLSTNSIMRSAYRTGSTQSTASFHIDTDEDKRLSNPYIVYNNEKYECDTKGNVTLKNLPSNTQIIAFGEVEFNGHEYRLNISSFHTDPLNPDVIAEVGPTSITVTPTYDKMDGIVKSSSLTINGQEYDCKSQTLTGLPAGSSVSVVYSLNNEEAQKSYQLPELVLTTLPARATSKDCAIICAETNMSEDEIGGGFEWRRYDAPDMVPSNSVACPVANGHMEGRLNGLSSGTYYKYRPFYEDASGNKTYGEWTAFGTADVDVYFVPTVYTYTARSVGSTSATLVGYALAGSEDVTEQGFEYWPADASRATPSEVKRVLATGQRMMATIDDLEPGTTYNVRAFATTKTETTYGELQQFETEATDDPIQGSIDTVETAEPAKEFDIYNLQGRCVRRNASDFSSLRPGIYIANGRKIMVR